MEVSLFAAVSAAFCRPFSATLLIWLSPGTQPATAVKAFANAQLGSFRLSGFRAAGVWH